MKKKIILFSLSAILSFAAGLGARYVAIAATADTIPAGYVVFTQQIED